MLEGYNAQGKSFFSHGNKKRQPAHTFTDEKKLLKEYGIPHMFFADNRTVFEYNRQKDKTVEKDTFTQFKYACKQLGVEIKTSSVPQAKGRVERVFNTLQSRLPVELCLANVTSIQQANEFLVSYLKKFNTQFVLPFDHIKSVFEKQLSDEKITLTLSTLFICSQSMFLFPRPLTLLKLKGSKENSTFHL